jgi:hypothetical protein
MPTPVTKGTEEAIDVCQALALGRRAAVLHLLYKPPLAMMLKAATINQKVTTQ